MIIEIRSYLQNKFVRLLFLLVTCIMMGLFSIPLFFRHEAKPWVLKINDTTIDRMRFETLVSEQQERLSSFKAQYGQYANMLLQSFGMSSDPKKLATDLLIRQALLFQFSEEIGCSISANFAKEMLNNNAFSTKYLSDVVPHFLYEADGSLSQNIVKMFLQKRRRISSDIFLTEVAQGISRQMGTTLLEHSFYLPRYEKELLLRSKYGKKNLKIVHLSENEFVENARKQKIDEAVLIEFHKEKNRTAQTYFMPEKRDAKVWSFSLNDYAFNFQEDEMKTFYNENKNKNFIDTQATARVRQILYKMEEASSRPSIATLQEELVTNPAKFPEYVKKYSQDEASALQGGLIEPLVYGQKNNQFYKAAFSLQNPGDISRVIQTDEGFVIIQLIEKKEKVYKDFKVVKNEIKALLAKKAFKESFLNEIKLVLKDGVIDNSELKSMVQKHKAHFSLKNDITLRSSQGYLKKVFELQKINDIAFFVDGDTGYLIKLENIREKFEPSFQEVKDEVVRDWYNLQGAQLLQKKYNEFEALVKTMKFEDVAVRLDCKFESIVFDPQDKKKLANGIFDKVSVHPHEILNIEKEGIIINGMSKSGAYFIKCDQITVENSLDLTEDDINSFDRQQSYQLVEGIVASSQRAAKIKVNDSFNLPIEDYII